MNYGLDKQEYEAVSVEDIEKNRQEPSIDPGNLGEKLAVDEAANALRRHVMEEKLNDPRYSEHQWKKMNMYINLFKAKTTIHFWENRFTGQREGFKFKN